jgi:hypothetical protein
MRPRAQALFAQARVEVLTETKGQESETIVGALLNGALVADPSSRHPSRRKAQADDAQERCSRQNGMENQ